MKTLSKTAEKRIRSALRNTRRTYSFGPRGGFQGDIERCIVPKKDLQLLLDLALEINKQHD